MGSQAGHIQDFAAYLERKIIGSEAKSDSSLRTQILSLIVTTKLLCRRSQYV